MGKKAKSQRVSEHIAQKSGEICTIVDSMLNEMKSSERISGAPLNQLSSALGVLVDKFADNGGESSDGELAKIFKDFEEIK